MNDMGYDELGFDAKCKDQMLVWAKPHHILCIAI